MKKCISFLNFSILILFSAYYTSYSQWEPDVILSPDSIFAFTSRSWCVAATGDTVHIVWADNRDGISFEVYYLRSTDRGLTWAADTMLSAIGNRSWTPSIAANNINVHVTWVDERDGNKEIYYKGSTDGGVTWRGDKRLTNSSSESITPSIAVSGTKVHVVFKEQELNQPGDIFYRRSANNGSFWETDIRLTNDQFISENPSIAVNGQMVNVVWSDSRDGNYEIYYKRSLDEGVTWGNDIRLTLDGNSSVSPTIAATNSYVYIFWSDDRDGNSEIYFKLSTDNGISWSADTRLTFDSAGSQVPSVSSMGSVIHIVWIDGRDGNNEIYYKRSIDNGLSWSNDESLTLSSEVKDYQSIALSDSTVHAVWTNNRDNTYSQIVYRRNLSGNPTTIKTVNILSPGKFILQQNYPNPFNPSTTIKYSIPTSEFVTLKVYDALGKEVATLVNEEKPAGSYEVEFNAAELSSGIYFCKLQSGSFVETKKMILLK